MIQPSMSFFVPGTPRPQGSKRHVGNGRMIESSKYVKGWRDWIELKTYDAIKAQGWRKVEKPNGIRVQLVFRMPRPKAMKQHEQRLHLARPDVDKLSRAVFDAMSDLVYSDDSQVVCLTANKVYAPHGEEPGVHIHIQEVEA
jgi:crossover junction endodeoxyribonuclease RusA